MGGGGCASSIKLPSHQQQQQQQQRDVSVYVCAVRSLCRKKGPRSTLVQSFGANLWVGIPV